MSNYIKFHFNAHLITLLQFSCMYRHRNVCEFIS